MASRVNPWRAVQSLSIRSRPFVQSSESRAAFVLARRGYADDSTNRSDDTTAASSSQSDGDDLAITSGADGEAAAIQDYSHLHETFVPNFLNAEAIARLEAEAAGRALEDRMVGYKFHIPDRPGKTDHLQNRYSPVVTQLIKLMMRDGKLAKAEKDMSLILNFLRTSPAPKVSPLRPLLPGSPPPSSLPLNPEMYLTVAVDSVAPLLRIRNMKGMAGGGTALEVPEPMPARQRRRTAFQWILDTVAKKKSRGSGRKQFPARMADEIIAVVEGRSGVWDRRQIVHKLGTASRANLNHPALIAKRSK